MSELEKNKRAFQEAKSRRAAKEKFADFIDWALARPSNVYIYRGQEQNWALKPSVARKVAYQKERELLLLEEFKLKAVSYLPNTFTMTDWEWLALAQHHGLPTRLLDWSDNVLVACYFASKPSPRGKRDGQITAVRTSSVRQYDATFCSNTNPFEIDEDGIYRPPNLAGRIISQRGSFSIHHRPSRAWQPRKAREDFVVPADMKADFRRFLYYMGVDAAFLMNDLDGVSDTLKWLYESKLLT